MPFIPDEQVTPGFVPDEKLTPGFVPDIPEKKKEVENILLNQTSSGVENFSQAHPDMPPALTAIAGAGTYAINQQREQSRRLTEMVNKPIESAVGSFAEKHPSVPAIIPAGAATLAETINTLIPKSATDVGEYYLGGKIFKYAPSVIKKVLGKDNFLTSDIAPFIKKVANKYGFGKSPDAVEAVSSALKGSFKGGEAVAPKFTGKYEGTTIGKKLESIDRGPEPAVKTPITEGAATPTPMPVKEDVVQKVVQALKEAKPIRKQQENLYSLERKARMGKALKAGETTTGEAGFKAELREFGGEMPKVQYEGIRNKVGQEDIDSLFSKIKDSEKINDWEKLPARKGLAKMFGEYGGAVPTENELSLLKKVFGEELPKTLLDKRSFLTKAKEFGYELANVPRAMMASFDLSAPLRQGAFFSGRLRQFVPAFKEMFGAFRSEKAYQAIQENIMRKPTYQLMKESKLALTDIDAALTSTEEKFMGAGLAEKIPLIGRGIRASNRAYTGFLNKLRADVFDDLVSKAEKLGRNPQKDMALTKQIAGFVNAGTGRGSLGSFEKAAVVLNSTMFSPRLMASRLQLMNPIYYVKLDPFVRKEALKSLFTYTSTLTTVLSLYKLMGAEVGTNPTSADFAKPKIRNTRLDYSAGFQQYIKLASQLLSGKITSSTTGKVREFGKGYRPLTRLDALARFAETKEAPVLSFATGLLRGENVIGEKFKVLPEIGTRFIPMIAADIYDLAKEDPTLLPLSALEIFGVGLQTYSNKRKKK